MTVVNMSGATPASVDPLQVPLAAFDISDAEHQARLAGADDYPVEVSWQIAERRGVDATLFALDVRSRMHLGHANELRAFAAAKAPSR